MSGGRDQSPVEVDGMPDKLGDGSAKTKDLTTIDILKEISKDLRIIKTHLQIITGEEIKDED